MAIVAYSQLNPIPGVIVVTWANLSNGDTGAPYVAPQYPDKNIIVSDESTFGVGGSVQIEETNETAAVPTANYVITESSSESPVIMTAADSKQLVNNAYQLRPNVTAGDGTTDITVRMCMTTTRRV